MLKATNMQLHATLRWCRRMEKKDKPQKYVSVKLRIPQKHFEVIEKVAALLECKPDLVLQRSLNHALKSGTLGHVLESMLCEKYRDVFNSSSNGHDLTL
jgi:hypothetical protein